MAGAAANATNKAAAGSASTKGRRLAMDSSSSHRTRWDRHHTAPNDHNPAR